MRCISTFLEAIDHEMPNYTHIVINRESYKVDGNSGIKVYCSERELKSVDYFDLHPSKGFLYLEFSDLIAQDEQIKEKLKQLDEIQLPKEIDREIRKQFYNKKIHQELVQKLKDSVYLNSMIMPKHIVNIPKIFETIGHYVIVIAPIEESKRADVARCIDRWRDAIRTSMPKDMYDSVSIITLDQFLAA
ncbi:hypothetical protein [Acinetobacter guerrae]|uniref:hypothetical protein n=1 Tax=Acinetobacter guerrae TaxID=1843371 RepID=UPI00128E8302|nr:hypothetical protein [Acinetobacter guerrae]MPW44758.1 hypothetical protein [Acinetobacter guerrae]